MKTCLRLSALLLTASTLHAQSVIGIGDLNPSPAISPTWSIDGGLIVGNTGIGSLEIKTGGQVDVDDTSYFGNLPGSSGSVTLNGGTFLSSERVDIAYRGTGTLNINSGAFTVETPVGVEALVLVGTLNGSSGTINMSGGSFNIVNGYLSLGAGGGSASASGGLGQMTITGGTVDLSGELRVGDDAVGTLNISGGNISSSLANIGRQLWGTGTVTMSGGTWTNDSLFVVGNEGIGSFTLTGGTVSNVDGEIGRDGGDGTVEVSGGTWTNSGSLYVGKGQGSLGNLRLIGAGVVNVGGGTVYVTHDPFSWGQVNFGSENLAAPTTAGTLNATKIVFEAGPGRGKINFNQTDTVMLDADISGAGAVFQRGSGTTVLTGTNTYTGATTVEAGTLIVDGSITSAVTVKNGAAFGGDGVVGNITLESGSSLVPINSLSANSLTWNSNATLVFGLGDAVNDQLSLTGSLNKGTGGSFGFTFTNDGWQVGQTYSLITFAGATTFNPGDFSFTNGGGFNGTFDIAGNAVQFTLTAVPEPSTWMLFGMGFLAVVILNRRNNSRPGNPCR